MTATDAEDHSDTDDADLYYDPYDFEIDTDPYPVWRRLRDERPLYHNDRYDFYALSRFEDVERSLVDWRTYSSEKGTLLELIKSGMEIPPGSIIFEDRRPTISTAASCPGCSRPGRWRPSSRRSASSAPAPSTRWWARAASTSSATSARRCPCGRSACCSASRSRTRRRSATRSTTASASRRARCPTSVPGCTTPDQAGAFADYIDWRADHPSDDLMTELLQAEYTDTEGTRRHLTREDVPNAIEELLRFEPPSPVQARLVTRDVENHGQVVPEGSAVMLLNASGNRDERRFPDPDRFDVRRHIDHHLSFGYGIHFCLGAALARLEGRVAPDEVLQRFPTWEVDTDNAVQARTSTVRGWERLPVVTS